MTVRFNIPYKAPKALAYVEDVLQRGKTSGNHSFSKSCTSWFRKQFYAKHLLTTSCTDALEMAALLCDIQPGDEVIIPSYTFVSTANPFVLRGASLRFADSSSTHPNCTIHEIEPLLSPATKAIVIMHYGGVACDIEPILALCKKHNIYLIEDAAQCIGASYKGRFLGSFGACSSFSFHESKNISCGEGGLLAVNEEAFKKRAEILWEKGTDRAAFWRGEVDKYGWKDIGSSYLLSDILAAVLWAQLENADRLKEDRLRKWQRYDDAFAPLQAKKLNLPQVPFFASHNGHIYYVVTEGLSQREELQNHLKSHGIESYFHYQSLHKSDFMKDRYQGPALPNADAFSEGLLRLPIHYYLDELQQDHVISTVLDYYK